MPGLAFWHSQTQQYALTVPLRVMRTKAPFVNPGPLLTQLLSHSGIQCLNRGFIIVTVGDTYLIADNEHPIASVIEMTDRR